MKTQIPWKKLHVDRVLLAQSGHQALEILQKERPQLMIADINMPEMSGIRLIEESYRLQPKLAVIVLTGYDYFEYARDALRLHVKDYLLKPIDEEQLCACVKAQTELLLAEKNNLPSDNYQRQLALERMIRALMADPENEESILCLSRLLELRADSVLQPVLLQLQPPPCSKEDEELLLHQIRLFCLYEIDYRRVGFHIPAKPDRQLQLILIRERCPEGAEQKVHSLLELLRNEFSVEITARFGTVFSKLSKLADACRALESQSTSSSPENLLREDYPPFLPVSDPGEVLRIYRQTVDNPDILSQSDEMTRWNVFHFLSDFYYCCVSSGLSVPDDILSKALNVLRNANREDCIKLGEEYLRSMHNGNEKEMNELVMKAIQHIESHLPEAISVSSLADMLYVSSNYFSRLFKKTVGEGCNEFIVRKRMEMAQSLLEQTNLPTSRISEMVGYNDTNYFSLAFRKNCGTTPTGWRKAHADKARK